MASAPPPSHDRRSNDALHTVEPRRRRPFGWVAIGAPALLVAASAFVAWRMWREVEGAVISTHGLMALVLGVGAMLLLAIALIGLVLFSSRRGFDDEAGNP